MKKYLFLLLMAVIATISAQAQMVSTNAKKDRIVRDNDNRAMQNAPVHNVVSFEQGYGILEGYHVSGLKYYFLNNHWGFQAGAQYCYENNYYFGTYYRDAYYLFLLGANKRTNDGYLYLNAGFGRYNGYYRTNDAVPVLEFGYIYVSQKRLSLSAGIQGGPEDINLTVGVGFDFYRNSGK